MPQDPVLAQVLSARARTAPPAALTLDLDDTLWPILPVILRCEAALESFLREHAPEVARRYPGPAMRSLRDAVFAERPDLAHDYGAVRRLSLERAFEHCGLRAPALVEAAYALFYATRNEVECYPEVDRTLPALAARHRLVALTNGNADLARIGLDHHFHGAVFARQVGCAKPDPRIFGHALALLGLPAGSVWHVGDDPLLDVVGARRAGMGAVWLNREDRPWPHPDLPAPDLVIRDLAELAAHLAELPPTPSMLR